MKLRQYLDKYKISPSAFSDRIGCSRQTLYNIMWGKGNVSAHVCLKIEMATHGKVKIKDLINTKKDAEK